MLLAVRYTSPHQPQHTASGRTGDEEMARKHETKKAADIYDGADRLTPADLEKALRGHDARDCQCSGCVLRRDRLSGEAA